MSLSTESHLAVHTHFQTDLFGFSSEGITRPTAPQYLWSSQRKDFIWASSLLLLSCLTFSSLSPLFPGQSFIFSPLCSSRVVLNGPVLPETPQHISFFCLLPFPFQASLSLALFLNALPPSVSVFNFFSLFLHPTPYQETEREAILKRARYVLFPLNGSVSI